MDIIEADKSLKSVIDKFYVEQGYHSNWSDTERAFVCLVDDNVIGAVKVETIHDVAILRGMYIADKHQKQGLGMRFLKHIEPVLNEKIAYCMPLEHVKNFYKQIGFLEVPENTYPEFLGDRCRRYRDAGFVITTMRREYAA